MKLTKNKRGGLHPGLHSISLSPTPHLCPLSSSSSQLPINPETLGPVGERERERGRRRSWVNGATSQLVTAGLTCEVRRGEARWGIAASKERGAAGVAGQTCNCCRKGVAGTGNPWAKLGRRRQEQWRQKPGTNHARLETLARNQTRIQPISPVSGSFNFDWGEWSLNLTYY